MRIGKIARSAGYRRDEQFQKCSIREISRISNLEN